MKQRNKAPNTAKPNVLESRLAFNRDVFNSRTMDPIFRYERVDSANSDVIRLSPYHTGGNDATLLIPFRLIDSDGNFISIIQHEIDYFDTQISQTGIDLPALSGGLVDGISAAASTDYLIWAFYDASVGASGFRGIGLTTRPRITGATISSGGGLGTSCTLNVTSGRGWTFPVGCRVIIRTNANAGSAYNQGTVTANTTSTVTAQLDAAYGSVGSEANADISGGGTREIIQTNMFQPRITSDGQLYPGGGTQYAYCYMGSLQTNSTSDLRFYRKRGDFYIWNNVLTYTPVSVAASTGATSQTSLRRWIGDHVYRDVGFTITARIPTGGLAGLIQVALGPDSARRSMIVQQTTAISDTSFTANSIERLPIRDWDTSFNYSITRTSTATATATINLYGYDETEF